MIGEIEGRTHKIGFLAPLQGLLVFFLAIIQALHGSEVVQSFLKTTVFQIILSHREQVTEIQKNLAIHTHKAGLSAMLGCAEAYVGFQVAYDLVITENGVRRKEHEVLDQKLVEHGDGALLNEVDLAELLAIVDNGEIRLVYPREHVDDEFVGEASLAVLEEVFEMILEILEDRLHDFCLHLWRDLLVEVELLDDQVEVVHEGVVHVLLDVAVQVGRDVVGLVRPLDLLDPDVQKAQLLVDEALEVVRLLQHIVDAAHQEREETQTDKLQNHAENVLIGRATRVISITHSCQSLQDEVDREYID